MQRAFVRRALGEVRFASTDQGRPRLGLCEAAGKPSSSGARLTDYPGLRQPEHNMHAFSLFVASAPKEAFCIANRPEMMLIAKQGSWLNTAERALSVMTLQCFTDRVISEAEDERRIGT